MSDSNIGKTYYLAEATWGNGVLVKPWDYNIVIPETPCNSSNPGIQMSTEAFSLFFEFYEENPEV